MSNTIIYVKYASGFQWGKSPTGLVPLSTPINTSSSSPITYEFISIDTNPIFYKLPPGGATGTTLPTSNGPTVVVTPPRGYAEIAFATTSGGTYYTGSVTVDPDDFIG